MNTCVIGLQPLEIFSLFSSRGSTLDVRIRRLQCQFLTSKVDSRAERVNPLDPNLLGITASPTEPPGAADPIGDIIIDHILPFKGSTQISSRNSQSNTPLMLL